MITHLTAVLYRTSQTGCYLHCCLRQGATYTAVSDRVLPTLLSQTGCYLHCCLRQGATYTAVSDRVLPTLLSQTGCYLQGHQNQILQSCGCADLKVFHEAQFTTSATILLLTNTHLQVFHQMLQDHPTTLLQDFILTCMCSMRC